MNETGSSNTKAIEWIDKFMTLFTEIVSRKYTLLEMLLLWILFTIFNAFFTVAAVRSALLLFEWMGYPSPFH